MYFGIMLKPIVMPDSKIRKNLLIIICFLLASMYLIYRTHVYEYAMTKPFSYFSYPLEVDMESVVQKAMHNEFPVAYPLNPAKYHFVMNNDRKCKDGEGNHINIFLLTLIKSKLEHLERRQMIRRTWARESLFAHITIKRVFLLGVDPKDKQLQRRVEVENQVYHDIVQQYFVDSYFNTTLKVMMGFQWAVQYCQGAQFLAFLDDDYFLNTYHLVVLLQHVNPTEYGNLLIGHIWKNMMPIRVKSHKLYMSLDEYPYRFWPPYATGGSIFVPFKTAEKLYYAMQFTKTFRFDDVFLGIAAWKLRVKLQHNKNLHVRPLPYNKETYRYVIAAHGFDDPQLLYDAWTEQHELAKNVTELKARSTDN